MRPGQPFTPNDQRPTPHGASVSGLVVGQR
jgi:hypothetical protein